jgi:two-component system sensor histidine kinase TctE
MPFPREQRSLFGEILDWMLTPLLLLWPMSVALTWAVAQGVANRPYDRALGHMARSIAQQLQVVEDAQDAAGSPDAAGSRAAPAPNKRFAMSSNAALLLYTDEVDTIFYQVLGGRGEFVSGDRTLNVPVSETPAPPGELRFRDDQIGSEPVRVAYLWVQPSPGLGGAPFVQVAETLNKRSQLATEIIKGVILPQFVILPLAVILVWFALTRGIAPLGRLQERIRNRAADDLSPIDATEVPEEVSPLVRAINELLGRLDRSLSTQKRFLADAAHQLKTPLAGLRTQAELAQREIDLGERDPEALKRSLQQIALSSQRAAHMVNQLLAMARADDASLAASAAPLDLAQLATETVREFVPLALEKQIDLGYEGPGAGAVSDDAPSRCWVRGDPVLLHEVIGNLVDNAIRYTPRGGAATVRVLDDPFGQVVLLQVEDSGPGIDRAERDLVLQPFYRTLGTQVDGSGLGLAIVAEIARQHGATLELGDSRAPPLPDGATPGARFTLRFRRLPAAEVGPVTPAPAAPEDHAG